MKSQLLALYQQCFGHRAEAITDLRADGSNRLLFRIFGPGGESVVGVFGPDHEENRAFLSFSRSFRSIGLPVPEIYAADEEGGIYLEEDLGDITLFAALSAARAGDESFPEEIVALYEKVITILPRVQVGGGHVIDFSVAYPCAEFDRKSMTWDLNYFKYHFLKLAHIPFNEARLEADFDRLCDYLLEADRSNFLYRDFQSRNIMIRDGAPWLIDYQGGRRGALQYDIASLLYDAKAAIPEPVRDRLLDVYLDALGNYMRVDRVRFAEHYRGFVLIRIMQALGAYGYRGFFERKAHFLASVPYAVDNIKTMMERGLPFELPELEGVFERIISIDDLRLTIDDSKKGSEARAIDDLRFTIGDSKKDDEARAIDDLRLTIYDSKREDEARAIDDLRLTIDDSKKDDEARAIDDLRLTIDDSKKGDEARAMSDSQLVIDDSRRALDEPVESGNGRSMVDRKRESAHPSFTSIDDRQSNVEHPLAVTITSFSYKRGYPEPSEHGGGFVFDCRALHNPGRYERYKSLSGRDGEVIDFLEAEESVARFWESVRGLVDPAVEAYLERGFTDLSVAFGCTGGQHRSVYIAERLARHLRERYPQVRVELRHREEERWREALRDER
jgi:aminoglycoside/choline kinase family phosphotransferase